MFEQRVAKDDPKGFEGRLLALAARLGAAERETLLSFAEFLLARQGPAASVAPALNPLPRPERETVVGAIKRLVATYPMLEKRKVLHETSDLMAQHVMHGRPATQVIDELERCFRRHYEHYLTRAGETS